MFANYQIKNVNGHVEVYDMKGNFLFSSDSMQEAMHELEHMQAA